MGSAPHPANTQPETSDSHPPTANPILQVPRWLWRPYLLVFLSSGCIMVLELVAGRIIAPWVGVSLYTWTTVIGVVLAGISLGNFLGGWLADRRASPRLLGTILLLAGLSSFGILGVDALGRVTPDDWPLVAEILVLTATLFLLPCALLGTLSPVVAKLAVRDLGRTGITVGRIYAAGTVGSIVGTFATGYFLISWLGTHTIVWCVAVVLLALGFLLLLGSLASPGRRWFWILPVIAMLAGGSVMAPRLGWLRAPCSRETNYFCITVQEQEHDGQPVRVLILDRLVHSYSSLEDPTQLVYGYEQIYAEVTAYRARDGDHMRVLFVGGGGYTFPRYMEAVYPSSDLHVIEIDPGVTQIAHQMLGLDRDTRIVTYNQDARLYLKQEPSERYDLILGDAFNDFSVPYHLTTREFNDRVRAWLEDDGLYVINLVDGPRGAFLRATLHTLRQTFAHVYLVPTLESWRRAAHSTFVLIGTDAPLDVAALQAQDAEGELLLVQRLLSQEEVEELLAADRTVMLTDRYAPVDQMLAPVFRGEAPR